MTLKLEELELPGNTFAYGFVSLVRYGCACWWPGTRGSLSSEPRAIVRRRHTVQWRMRNSYTTQAVVVTRWIDDAGTWCNTLAATNVRNLASVADLQLTRRSKPHRTLGKMAAVLVLTHPRPVGTTGWTQKCQTSTSGVWLEFCSRAHQPLGGGRKRGGRRQREGNTFTAARDSN